MVNAMRPVTNVPPTPRVVRNAMNIPYNALAHAANAALSADTAKEWAAHYVGKSPQFAYDVVTGLPNVIAEGYRGMKGQMTGATPLVTGEPGRPHTDADTYQAAKQSIDALGAAGLFSVAAPARAAALGARTRPAASIFTAYHGSPHDFDKFSMDKIGTGEGAQAYGHGLYFADSPDVAKSYRGMLSNPQVREGYFGKLRDVDQANPKEYAALVLHEFDGDKVKAIANLRSEQAQFQNYLGETAGQAADLIESGKRLPKLKNTGVTYEVNIKANKDDFLDWDIPISQQSDTVKSAIRAARGDLSSQVKVEEITDPDGSVRYFVQTPTGTTIVPSRSMADDIASGYRNNPVDEETTT